MSALSPSPCAICGSLEGRVVGRCGVVCRRCVADAASGIIGGPKHIAGPLTASDLCLLCGEPVVTQGNVAAFSGPYRICFACVRHVLELSNVLTDGTLSQIRIGGP